MGRGKSSLTGACHTCRVRHVKCDQGQPKCQRCQNSRIECEGYVKKHRWIDENPKLDGRKPSERNSTKKQNAVVSAESLTDNNSHNGAILRRSGCSNTRTNPATAIERLSTSSTTSIPAQSPGIPALNREPSVGEEMPLTAFEDTIYTNFLLTHLLKTQPIIASWLTQHVSDFSSPAASASVRALCTTYFGRVHNEQSIIQRGTTYYVFALRHLNSDLQDKNKCTSLSVLRAVDTLKLLEYFALDNRAGWQKHAIGIGRLIEFRGPHAFQNPWDRVHLEDNKAAIAISSSMNHKRCFLSNPDWRAIPWEHDSELKTPKMYLDDFFCDVPDLLADGRALLKVKSSPSSPPPEVGKMFGALSAKLMRVLAALFAWRAKWDVDNPSDICTEVQTDSLLFSTQLRLTTLQHTRDLIAYDGLLLVLLELGHRVMGTAFSPAAAAATLPPRPRPLQARPLIYPGDDRLNSQSVAIEICRCVKFFLDHDGSDFGPFHLAFPLVMAKGVFRGKGAIGEWLDGVMGRVIDISALGVGQHYIVGGENI